MDGPRHRALLQDGEGLIDMARKGRSAERVYNKFKKERFDDNLPHLYESLCRGIIDDYVNHGSCSYIEGLLADSSGQCYAFEYSALLRVEQYLKQRKWEKLERGHLPSITVSVDVGYSKRQATWNDSYLVMDMDRELVEAVRLLGTELHSGKPAKSTIRVQGGESSYIRGPQHIPVQDGSQTMASTVDGNGSVSSLGQIPEQDNMAGLGDVAESGNAWIGAQQEISIGGFGPSAEASTNDAAAVGLGQEDAGRLPSDSEADAERIREEAKEEAAQIKQDAGADAEGIRQKAETEAAQIIQDAEKDADQIRKAAKEEADKIIRERLEGYLQDSRAEEMCEASEAIRSNETAAPELAEMKDELVAETNRLKVDWRNSLDDAIEQLKEIQADSENKIRAWQRSLYAHELRDIAFCYIDLYSISCRYDRILANAEKSPAGNSSSGATEDGQNLIEGLRDYRNSLNGLQRHFERALGQLGLYVYVPQEGDDYQEALQQPEHPTGNEDMMVVARCVSPGIVHLDSPHDDFLDGSSIVLASVELKEA